MRFDLHAKKTEQGWADAWADFWKALSDGVMSVVQWALVLGVVRYARESNPTSTIIFIEIALNFIFVSYLSSFAFLKLDIVVFKGDPRTGWRVWVTIAVTLAVAATIYFGTRFLVTELVEALPKSV